MVVLVCLRYRLGFLFLDWRFIDYLFFHLWHAIAQTDIMVGSTDNLERFCLLEGSHEAWFVCMTLQRTLERPTQLTELIGAP